MRDFINVGVIVLVAMLFAASQLDDIYAAQGAKFTQTSRMSISPSLADYVDALGDGTVLNAARDRLGTLREALLDANRG